MSDNNIKSKETVSIESTEAVTEKPASAGCAFSVGYILGQLELIRRDNEYIMKAISSLENLVINSGAGDIANQARCEAIGNIVSYRETTNQKLIAFYEMLYNDMRPPMSNTETAVE